LIVPYLVTPWSTYTALLLLLIGHLTANYIAVRGVVLRTLNRQRAGIAWTTYRHSGDAGVLSPTQVSKKERIFELSGVLRDAHTGRNMGHCTIGSSARGILSRPIPSRVLDIFDEERYLLWFDPRSLCSPPGHPGQRVLGPLRLHVCLKEGYLPSDQLKAWVHAAEVGRTRMLGEALGGGEDEASAMIRIAYKRVEKRFSSFVERMGEAGWKTDDGQLLTGSPKAVVVSIRKGGLVWGEEVGSEEKKRL